jgi:hypothetical protein
MTRQKIVSCLVLLVMNKYLDFMLFILPTPLIHKHLNHHFKGQNSTVIGYCSPYYQIFHLPHCSQVTAHRSPLTAHRSQDSTPPLSTDVFRFKYMFNISIREYFSVLNVFIVCICKTVRSKSIPLLCTHVGSYKFSTVHPPSISNQNYH